MIIHFFHSDRNRAPQFITYVVDQFESPEMCSEFVIVSDSEHDEITIHNRKIRYVNSAAIGSFLESLCGYSAIVLHGLFYPWCECVLRKVPKQVKVAWMFWGGELYGGNSVFLAPYSRFLNNLHSLIKKEAPQWHLPSELYQRIDYCLTGEKEEYEYAKEFLNLERTEHIWYTYYSIEDTVGELYDSFSWGNNVWLCNSSSIENNAFDAIARLLRPKNRKHLRGRTIIMPLSYGALWIRNAMTRIGPVAFRSGFHPLLDFMPRVEYNRLLLDCSTIILPHYRPAAQGNILTALWLGIRVYLSEKSMSFLFFKRLGVHIYSFESDFYRFGCSRLSKYEVDNNRRILSEWYGKKHIKEACLNVVFKLQ